MSRKVFTAGEVLAAADVNSFLMDQTVMSFAGTAARGSAIPSPVNGMTTYLEDTRDLQIYDGSAYNSTLGLTLVKRQTIGTTVASVTVTGAFSSQYDTYLIHLAGGVSSTTSNLLLQLGSTTSNYYDAGFRVTYNSTTLIGEANSNSNAFSRVCRATANGFMSQFELTQPFNNVFTGMRCIAASQLGGDFYFANGGFLADTTSYTAFTLTANVGTITGGTIYVYGYRKN
jgi:hypothetical protein